MAFICCKESILLLLFESIWINLGYYKSTENYSNWSALFILMGIISSRKSIPPYTGHEGSLSGLNSMLIIWYDLHSHQISTQFNNYGSFWTDILDRGLYHHHQIPIKNGVHSPSAFPKLCRIDARHWSRFGDLRWPNTVFFPLLICQPSSFSSGNIGRFVYKQDNYWSILTSWMNEK